MEDQSTVLEDDKETIEAPEPEDTEAEEADIDESPEETAQKVYDELKAKSDGEEDPQEETHAEPSKPSENTSGQKVEKKEETADDYELASPPERLNPKQRAIYKRASPAMKRILHDVVRDLESGQTKALSYQRAELAQKSQKYRDLDAIMDDWREELAALGHNDVSAIAEMKRLHKALRDPQKKFDEYERLGQQIGYDWSRAGQGSSDTDNLANNPTIKALRDENKQLREMLQPLHNGYVQSVQQTHDSALQEMRSTFIAVAEEVDGAGRLLYPKLSEDPQYFDQRLRPLVVGLMRSDPDLSYGEALKRAYNVAENRQGYPSQSPTRPSPQNNKTTTRPLTVRGKSTSVSDLAPIEEEIDPSESPEETAWKQYRRMARG